MATMEITKDNFTASVTRDGIVILDFWAAWCGPCRMFGPVFEGASEAHPDVTFGKVNVDVEQELAAAFGVRSIPTTMVFRDSIMVFVQPGALPAQALDRLLGEVRGLDMEVVRREAKAMGDGEPT